MRNKILGFQFESMDIKQTCPNYSVGSDQEEAEIQYDRLSTLEWCNCETCEKMSTSLERVWHHDYVCYLEIQAVRSTLKTQVAGKTFFYLIQTKYYFLIQMLQSP